MDLHYHPVLHAHRRHLRQHLGPEQLGIRGRPGAAHNAPEQRLLLGLVQVGGERGRMAVIGGGGAGSAEVGAAPAVRGKVTRPALDILAGQLAEAGKRGAEVFMLRVDDRVRAVGRDDPPATGLADGGVVGEVLMRPSVVASTRC